MSDFTEPLNKDEADKLLKNRPCPVCFSWAVAAMSLPPLPWMVHCKNCGSSIPLHVFAQLIKWRTRE